MAFHKMPSGHFAYVINDSGNKQLVTEEQFQECCCPAPCACPCETWPPDEWPCAGLLETYSLTAFELNRAPTSRYRLKSSLILTAHPTTACTWQATGTVEFSNDDGETWEDQTHSFSVSIQSCAWVFRFPTVAARVEKHTGQTPIGSYNENVNVLGFPSATMSASVS